MEIFTWKVKFLPEWAYMHYAVIKWNATKHEICIIKKMTSNLDFNRLEETLQIFIDWRVCRQHWSVWCLAGTYSTSYNQASSVLKAFIDLLKPHSSKGYQLQVNLKVHASKVLGVSWKIIVCNDQWRIQWGSSVTAETSNCWTNPFWNGFSWKRSHFGLSFTEIGVLCDGNEEETPPPWIKF